MNFLVLLLSILSLVLTSPLSDCCGIINDCDSSSELEVPKYCSDKVRINNCKKYHSPRLKNDDCKKHCCDNKKDCSSIIREIECVLRSLPILINNTCNESMNELVEEIIRILKTEDRKIVHSIQSDLEELTRELIKCLELYHTNDLNALSEISKNGSDKMIKEVIKVSSEHGKNIENNFNQKLTLPDHELLLYVRDINNGMLPFMKNEMKTMNENVSESIKKEMKKMFMIQKNSVGEVNSKRIKCIIESIVNTSKKIKKTIFEEIAEIIKTINGGVIDKIIKALNIKLKFQLSNDSIIIVEKITRYIQCIRGNYEDDISLDRIITINGIQPIQNHINM